MTVPRKKAFNTASTPLSAAERSLRKLGIEYTKQQDGMIVVEGDIIISHIGLTKLPDLSNVIVKGHFWCAYNQLTSLQGSPASVGKSFGCHYNRLTTLQGAPASVGNNVRCDHNPALKNLEGAPQTFQKLYSDFGEFLTWEAVPKHLRISPETIQKRQEEEQKKQEQAIRDSIYLKEDIFLFPPLRLKKKPPQLKD